MVLASKTRVVFLFISVFGLLSFLVPFFVHAEGGGGGGGWPPTVTSFAPSATSIPTGQSVTISWQGSTDSNACIGTGTGFSTSNLISGSDATGALPAGTHMYTLYCSNNYGSSATASFNVYVGTPQPAPTVTLENINAGTVYTDNYVSLSWSSTDATSCTVNQAPAGSYFNTSGATTGWQMVWTPSTAGTYTYGISCTGGGGTTNKSVNVVVIQTPPPPTATIGVNPTTAPLNTSATITWSSTNATSCTGTGFSTNGAVSGSAVTAPLAAGTYTYTVDCYGGGGVSGPVSATVTASSQCTGSNCGQVCVNVSSAQPTVGQIDSQNGAVSIAAKTISFSLNAVNPNNPPTAPTITGPTTRVPNEVGTYGFTSTDPDGNTLRYLVDWNMDGAVDQILPSSGYVNSGTQQSANKSWSTLGGKTFQAKTEDSNGSSSSWASYSVTVTSQCSDGINNDPSEDSAIDLADTGCGNDPNDNSETPNPPPACSNGLDDDGDGYTDYSGGEPSCTTGTGTSETPTSPKVTLSCTSPSPCTISPGGSATLTWSTTGSPDSCKFADQTGTVSGSGGTRVVSPSATGSYDIYCTKGSENSTHVQTQVTVLQPYTYIEASPDRVNAGAATNVSFSANQVLTSCEVRQNGTRIWGPTAPVPVPGAIASTTVSNVTIDKQTTFSIVCDTGSGAATDSVIVNVVPKFQEF